MIRATSQDQNQVKHENMDILDLDPDKHLYGVQIDDKIFLASLCQLPTIIEGQKTLDFRMFYKSVDVAQILYVHNKVIDDVYHKSQEEITKIAKEFNPVLEDQEFMNNLYRRQETKQMVEEQRQKGEGVKYEPLKFRHGVSSVAKNVRNIRHKKEIREDPSEVHSVEKVLKDIIDYGFADNVEEELLDFNDQGDLVSCIKSVKEKIREQPHSGLIQLDIFGDYSARSESNYQNQYLEGQSSLYSGQVDQYYDEGGTSYNQPSLRDDSGMMMNDSYPTMSFTQPQQKSTIQISLGGMPQQYQNQGQIQQTQQDIMAQQPSSFNQPPLFSQEDYQQMKSELKQLKRLIKNTQSEIQSLIQQGVDVTELKTYHQQLLSQRDQVKYQKKLAKRQLKQQNQ